MFQSLFSSLPGATYLGVQEKSWGKKTKKVLRADHCAFWSDGFDAFSDTLMAS